MDVICDTSFLIALVSNPIKCLDKVESEIGKSRNVDNDILDYVKRNRKFAVATLDGILLNRLRTADITTITLSKNKMIIANRYFEE